MTVNASVLTADLRTVPASWRAVLGALLLVPLVGSAVLVLSRRAETKEYQFISASDQAHAKVLQYSKLTSSIMQVERKLEAPERVVPLQKLATQWIEAAKAGQLQPLEPVAYDDTSLEGVKNQVFRAAAIVASSLSSDALEKADRGRFEEATDDVLNAFQVIETMWGSDVVSVPMANQRERRIFFVFKSFASHLNCTDRARVLDTISNSVAKHDLAAIVARARSQYTDAVARDGFERVSRADERLLDSLEGEIAQAVDPEARMKQIRSEVTRRATLAPRPVIDVTLAYLTEVENRRQLAAMLAENSKGPA
jgi:hypothetical protein